MHPVTPAAPSTSSFPFPLPLFSSKHLTTVTETTSPQQLDKLLCRGRRNRSSAALLHYNRNTVLGARRYGTTPDSGGGEDGVSPLGLPFFLPFLPWHPFLADIYFGERCCRFCELMACHPIPRGNDHLRASFCRVRGVAKQLLDRLMNSRGWRCNSRKCTSSVMMLRRDGTKERGRVNMVGSIINNQYSTSYQHENWMRCNAPQGANATACYLRADWRADAPSGVGRRVDSNVLPVAFFFFFCPACFLIT